MEKIFGFVSIVCCILLVISCNPVQSPGTPINQDLEFTLVYRDQYYRSFDDVSATVKLKNISDNKMLVNKRLFFRTAKFPPEMIEGILLITDSAGRQINLGGFLDIAFPETSFFVVLYPGQYLERNLSLRNVGFSPQYFKENELYNVVAIYQNSLDVVKIVDGEEVKAWLGEVQSNIDTFIIKP